MHFQPPLCNNCKMGRSLSSDLTLTVVKAVGYS